MGDVQLLQQASSRSAMSPPRALQFEHRADVLGSRVSLRNTGSSPAAGRTGRAGRGDGSGMCVSQPPSAFSPSLSPSRRIRRRRRRPGRRSCRSRSSCPRRWDRADRHLATADVEGCVRDHRARLVLLAQVVRSAAHSILSSSGGVGHSSSRRRMMSVAKPRPGGSGLPGPFTGVARHGGTCGARRRGGAAARRQRRPAPGWRRSAPRETRLPSGDGPACRARSARRGAHVASA